MGILRFYGKGENMLVVISYDVNTEDASGRKRLRKVSKECQNYGQRVQNSVFECLVDATQYKILEASLLRIIDKDKDSLRFYNLGNNYKTRVNHVGIKMGYDPLGFISI